MSQVSTFRSSANADDDPEQHGNQSLGSLNFEELLRFYQRPSWLNILRLFANIDEDKVTIAGRLGVALSELARVTVRATASSSSPSDQRLRSARPQQIGDPVQGGSEARRAYSKA